MAKMILEFDLADPDDRTEAKRMEKASDLCGVLFDLGCWLKAKLKHGDLSEGEEKTLDGVESKLHDLYEEYYVSLDSIYQ